MRTDNQYSPFVDFTREQWAKLSKSTPLPLSDEDVRRLAGLGDPIDLAEVDTVYRPLSRLLQLYVAGTRALHQTTSGFLGDSTSRTPFVIGVAGSVAVGKSSTSRLLREMMRRWPQTPHVELVTTDGFLYPNEELERRGLMTRKGFPESYNRRALLRFVQEVKSGAPEVTAPVYSHLTYDIVPGEKIHVRRPDVLIIEGLNVLQPARTGKDSSLAVSDFFDFSIYVDARPADVKRWYIERFLQLRSTAFSVPGAYFAKYAGLDDDAARAVAATIWDSINAPNLMENVAPTRGRASLVLQKSADHSMHRMRLRKL
ncbi:pantothenate kinase [Bowdeniella nasicola]|uniref:Pantothenate kinase n=1 Tax=Bowdeniella nasicola TaxID=208480 RepID=A0A1H3YPT8_9ACTO|nr:type I pantothenate kinase [Bowdeniella nasicola]SEA13589.1 pantothenate kinase [Bowdeniella nasicola]